MADQSEDVCCEFLLSFLQQNFDQATDTVLAKERLQEIFNEHFAMVEVAGMVKSDVIKETIKTMTHEQAALFTAKAYSHLPSENRAKYEMQTLYKAINLGFNDSGILKFIGNIDKCFSQPEILLSFIVTFIQNEELLRKVINLQKNRVTQKCLPLDDLNITYILQLVMNWPNIAQPTALKGMCNYKTDIDRATANKLIMLSDQFLSFAEQKRSDQAFKVSTPCTFCGRMLDTPVKVQELDDMYLSISNCLRERSSQGALEVIQNRAMCLSHILASVVSMKSAANIPGNLAMDLMYAVITTPYLGDEQCSGIVEQLIHTHNHQTEFKDDKSGNVIMYAAGYLRCSLLKHLSTLGDKCKLSDFSHRDDTGQTPLMSVSSRGRQLSYKTGNYLFWKHNDKVMEKQFLDTLHFILDSPQTDINAQDVDGNTALSMLLQQNIGDIVKIQSCKLFFEHDVRFSDMDYLYIKIKLSRATGKNSESFSDMLLAILLEYPHFDVNHCDPRIGETLLMTAAWSNVDLLQVLLSNSRADTKVTSKNGQTCLFYVCPNARLEGHAIPQWEQELCALPVYLKSFEILLAVKEINPNHIDKSKQTVLQYCMEVPDMDARNEYLKRLLVHHNMKNVNFQENGETALHMMIDCGEYSVVQKVLKAKARDSEYPVRFEIQNNHSKDVIDQLLAGPRNVTTGEVSYLDNFKLVTEQPNVPINYRFGGGRTLLIKACFYGCDPAVDFLLQNENIDLNLQDDLGYTALMYGINRLQYGTLVQFLLNPKCELTLINNKGEDLQQIVEKLEDVTTCIKDAIRIAIVRSSMVPSISSTSAEDHVKLLLFAVGNDSRLGSEFKEYLKQEIQCLEADLKTFSGGRYGHELAMSKEHRNKLRGCRVYICDELIPNPIFAYLVKDGVLNDDIVEEIRQEKTRKKTSEKLMSVLPLRGQKAYDSFLTALKDENQEHIAVRIEKYDPDQQEETTQLVPHQGISQDDWVPVMVPRNLFTPK